MSKKTIDDYRFKSSMLYKKVGLLTSGRSPQGNGLKTPHTSLQLNITIEAEDYG
jgi:hypothetical protein